MLLKTQSNSRKKFLLWLTLAIITLIFLAVVGMNAFIAKKKAEFIANMPEQAISVTAMKLEHSEWTPVIQAIGTIRPNQGTMLKTQMSGSIKKILIQSGEKVKKGDLLIELDSSVELASLKASEAQLPSVKANYQRYRQLLASKSVSQAEFDNAQATYNQLVANIESLKANIQRRQIYAPFDGIAGIVQVNAGEYVNAGNDIIRVEDNSKMKINFSLPQTDIKKVYIGQNITFSADSFAGQTFTAKISAIDPAVNKYTGLVDIEATIEEDNTPLLSGMFVRLEIQLPTQKSQFVLPQVAITYTMYGETAYILEPLSDADKENLSISHQDIAKMYRAKQIEVKTLERKGIYAHLAENDNLQVGHMLVTGGFQRLYNHALVMLSDKAGTGTTQPTSTPKL